MCCFAGLCRHFSARKCYRLWQWTGSISALLQWIFFLSLSYCCQFPSSPVTQMPARGKGLVTLLALLSSCLRVKREGFLQDLIWGGVFTNYSCSHPTYCNTGGVKQDRFLQDLRKCCNYSSTQFVTTPAGVEGVVGWGAKGHNDVIFCRTLRTSVLVGCHGGNPKLTFCCGIWRWEKLALSQFLTPPPPPPPPHVICQNTALLASFTDRNSTVLILPHFTCIFVLSQSSNIKW